MKKIIFPDGGFVIVRAESVAAITDFQPEPGRPPMLGASMLHLAGGGAIVIPLGKDTAAAALGLVVDMAKAPKPLGLKIDPRVN